VGRTVLLPHLAVTALQVGAFTLKVIFFCWLQILLRWTVPRFRYDQVMRLGWKMLLPLALLNVIITAIVIIAYNRPFARLMDASVILFYVISALLVLSSLMVVFLRNVIHCALALVAALS